MVHLVYLWEAGSGASYFAILVDFIVLKFILREREIVGEGQRERVKENLKQTLCCQCEAQCRAQSHAP